MTPLHCVLPLDPATETFRFPSHTTAHSQRYSEIYGLPANDSSDWVRSNLILNPNPVL